VVDPAAPRIHRVAQRPRRFDGPRCGAGQDQALPGRRHRARQGAGSIAGL